MANSVLNSVANLLRSIVSLIVLGFVAVAGWFGYHTVTSRGQLEAELQQRAAQVEKLEQDLAKQAQRIQELDLANRLLKLDHRLARISVVGQRKSERTQQLQTDILFEEIDDQGEPLEQARKFTIDGDILYVDCLVVKYLDKLVEAGDPLRGMSVCLFRRLYGENQEPSKGFPLDAEHARPAGYARGTVMPDFEREVWEHFWDYANDPQKAQLAGIRAAHGSAPFIKLAPHKAYIVELRSTGDLSIKSDGDANAPGEKL